MAEQCQISAGTGSNGLDDDSVLKRESLRDKMACQEKELLHLRGEMKKLQKCLRLIVSSGQIFRSTKKDTCPIYKSNITKATELTHNKENDDFDKCDDVIVIKSKTDSESNFRESKTDYEDDFDKCDDVLVITSKTGSQSAQSNLREFKTDHPEQWLQNQSDNRLRMNAKKHETDKDDSPNGQTSGDIPNYGRYCGQGNDDNPGRDYIRQNYLEKDDVKEDMSIYGTKSQSRNFPSSSFVVLRQESEVITDGKIGNTTTVQTVQDTKFDHLLVTIGVDTKDLEWEDEKMLLRRANADLSRRLDKIMKVNDTWDKFWSRKKKKFESLLAEKDTTICKLQGNEVEHTRQLQAAITEKEQILKDKDDVLLLTKARIDNYETTIVQLRKDLAEYCDKTERAQKFARTLLQQKKEQELEIKRLNKILEEKAEEHKYLKSTAMQHPFTNENDLSRQPLNDLSGDSCSETKRKQTTSDGNIKHSGDAEKRRESRRKSTSKEKIKIEKQEKSGCKVELIDEESLTKEELKEKLMHLKEQTNAYESDFRKERHDRERVAGKLQDMKEKLDETRQIQRKYNKTQRSRHGHTNHLNCCYDKCTHCPCLDERTRQDRTHDKNRTCLCQQ